MLSIIIPVYNSEEYIDKCIASIELANKRNPGILGEVIAINDGSKDRSLKKLNSLKVKYSYLKVIDQKNQGAGSARNKGLDNTTSNYISFVDADDTVDEMYLSPLIENKHDVISFNIIKEDKNGAHHLVTPNKKNGSIVSSFFKRSYIIENSIYAPEGINYEDNAICFLLYNKTKSKTHKKIAIYNYKYNKKSQSNTTSYRHAEDRIDSMLFLIENSKRLNIYNENKLTLDEMVFNLGYLPALSLCFREWGDFNKLSTLRKKLLSKVDISLPKDTKFKIKVFYFMIEKLGYLGYILICIKRINKIFK
ncbi:glycosyltransferase family 2 protein [Vibrio splendidus]